MRREEPIGVLDSGVGGLTVVKEIFRQLPNENVIYFGDTARCPYGPRPAKQVEQFTIEIVQYLMSYEVKMIVIACNTATAAALETVKAMVDIPVIGVIRPGSIAAIKNTKAGKIGVIGTEGTVNSGAYEKTLKEINNDLSVVSHACPTLVPVVEDGNYSEEEIRKIVKESIAPIAKRDIDSLILGCTHYPIISDYIQEAIGENVKLLSSAEETAREVSTILHYQGMIATSNQLPEHRFFSTGNKQHFKQIAEKWLGKKIDVEHVDINSYNFLDK